MAKSRTSFRLLFSFGFLLAAAALPALAGPVQIYDPSSISTDYFAWSQLGGDQTPIGTGAYILTSQYGYLASATLAGDDSLLQVVCAADSGPSAPCSYQAQTSGFAPGDTVLVTSTLDNSTGTGGNGPLSLSFSTGLPGFGAYVQQDLSTGPFTAELDLFGSAGSLGTFTVTSDDAGDPVFLGVQDLASEITGATIQLDSCTSEVVPDQITIPCSTADFAVDTLYSGTPEPSSWLLAATGLMIGLFAAWRKKRGARVLLGSLVALCSSTLVSSPAMAAGKKLPVSKKNRVAIVKPLDPTSSSAAHLRSEEGVNPLIAPPAPKLPLWSASVTSPLDNKTYPMTMVGSNPFLRGARPSTLNVIVVPLVITMGDTGEVFDPTAGLPSACIFNSEPPGSPLGLVQNSPIFENAQFTLNDQNIGNTQYVDAFQRANFWSYVSLTGSGFHNLLNPTYLPAQNLAIPDTHGVTYDASDDGGCGHYALLDVNWFNGQLQTLIAGIAQANPSNFVLFLTYNVFAGDTDIPEDRPAGCCILGFHSALNPIAAHNTQTYGFAAWDATGMFPGSEDVSVLAHELAEWVDDPYLDNITPAWGNVGQVIGGCQANLEVGDPISGLNVAPVSTGGAGYVYHLQELAFFSWFYRQSPSLGAGGFYSDNKTLKTGAGNLCDTAIVATDIDGNLFGPVAQGTQFNLIGLVSTPAQQVAPIRAPTGKIDVIDSSQDNVLCSGVAVAALAAPSNNASAATCAGPFNTAGSPWAVGLHNLVIEFTPTGSWSPATFTLPLTITAPAP